jgi:hypothetical protein
MNFNGRELLERAFYRCLTELMTKEGKIVKRFEEKK